MLHYAPTTYRHPKLFKYLASRFLRSPGANLLRRSLGVHIPPETVFFGCLGTIRLLLSETHGFCVNRAKGCAKTDADRFDMGELCHKKFINKRCTKKADWATLEIRPY